MIEVTAKTNLEVLSRCPHCYNMQDIYCDQVVEAFNENQEMRSDACEIIIECEECNKEYLVTTK